jgi:hypothetical protein
MDILSVLALVAFITFVVIKGVRRYSLRRRQSREETRARERHSTPDTLRRLQARHAFERGDNTRGVLLLRGDKPET